jgi:hypothetical protein
MKEPLDIYRRFTEAALFAVGCMPFLCKVHDQAAAFNARSLRLYKRSSKYQ